MMRRCIDYVVVLSLVSLVILPGSLCAQGVGRPLGPWDFLARLGVSAYTGYFGHRDGVNISFSAPDQPSGSVGDLRQQFRLQGISTQVMFPIIAQGPLGVVIGGGYSGCLPSSSEETVQRVGSGPVTRTWKVQPQGGNAQIAATLDIFPHVLGLIGFKYENFQTKFFNPNAGFASNNGKLDSANIAYSAYLPCLGFVLDAPPLFQGLNAQMGVIGCPVLLGSVDYKESWNDQLDVGGTAAGGFAGSNPISRGAYFNAFGEVSFTAWCGIQMGAYGKYEFMRAATGVRIGQGNSEAREVSYDFNFEKRLWGVGGRVSISF